MERPSVWCARHWEVVKSDGAAATVLLTERVVELPAFVAACGGADVSTCSDSEIESAMGKLSPLCCALAEDTIREMVGADTLVARLVRSAARASL